MPFDMKSNLREVFFAATLMSSSIAASEPPPLEAYGALPTIDLMVLSPSGERVAYRRTTDDQDIIAVFDLDPLRFVTGLDVGEIGVRQLRLVDDDTLIISAGRTARAVGFRGQFDFSVAFRFDVSTNSIVQLLRRADDLYPAQSGLGKIIGTINNGKKLLMPAFHSHDVNIADPRYGVYSVDIKTNRSRLTESGTYSATDWFASGDGELIARVDFVESEDLYQVWSLRGDKRKIYEHETPVPPPGPVGVMAGESALVYAAWSDDTDFPDFYRMDLNDGMLAGPITDRSEAEVERVLTDIHRVVYGFEYSGFNATYTFFDPKLNERVANIVSRMDGAYGSLVSWSDDFEDILFRVGGEWGSGAYLMFRDGSLTPELVEAIRPAIPADQVVAVQRTHYAARDGLEIPALVTAHAHLRENGNAPLLVLPHGGPAAYDRPDFDWLAQYFASRGYVVLQPQFRGSSGFGADFQQAGYGEWGGKMQTDIDDGVDFLIDSGLVDPERICIAGASYGGYAALAAGAFSPEKYRCIASIAGVSDLQRMLKSDRRKYGRDHWAISYWERQYGGDEFDWDALDAISPINFADRFQAPILLLHGRKDTVVPVDQSRIMRNALRRADKDVEMIELKGEDHWLSYGESRLETLRALAAFVEEHL